jgi:hypothetical protein
VCEFPKRQRRDIFVVQNPIVTQAPSGATYSDDAAPDGAWKSGGVRYYKDSAPTALANGSSDGQLGIDCSRTNKKLRRFLTEITIAITRDFAMFIVPLPVSLMVSWQGKTA